MFYWNTVCLTITFWWDISSKTSREIICWHLKLLEKVYHDELMMVVVVGKYGMMLMVWLWWIGGGCWQRCTNKFSVIYERPEILRGKGNGFLGWFVYIARLDDPLITIYKCLHLTYVSRVMGGRFRIPTSKIRNRINRFLTFRNQNKNLSHKFRFHNFENRNCNHMFWFRFRGPYQLYTFSFFFCI